MLSNKGSFSRSEDVLVMGNWFQNLESGSCFIAFDTQNKRRYTNCLQLCFREKKNSLLSSSKFMVVWKPGEMVVGRKVLRAPKDHMTIRH